MAPLFWEARSKIDRAEEHINELNKMIGELIDTTSYRVFVDNDADTCSNFLKVKAIKAIPARFAFVVGDALHNIRASLDYAMNEIELLTNGERTDYTAFPIRETPEGLKAAINGGLKQKAPEQVLVCIEDIVQPYCGGEAEPFWGLHQLDIMDKHQLLVTCTELTDIVGIRIEDDRGTEHIVGPWRVVDHLIAGVPVTGTKNVKITDQGRGTYRVTFKEGLPFGGNQIIPTLHHLAGLARWALAEVEYAFRRDHIFSKL
jgi:hypothetical protein